MLGVAKACWEEDLCMDDLLTTETEPVVEKTLDEMLAEALADENAKRDVLINLWQQALDTIEVAKETIATESERVLDLQNADPDKSDKAVRTAQRTVERLTKAVHEIKCKVSQIDAVNYSKAWHERADQLASERNTLADELVKLYPDFVKQLADLYARIDENAAAISDLHSRAPRGEPLRLFEDAEIVARGLERYTAEQPPLRDNLKLPNFDRSNEIAYPKPAPLNPFINVMLDHIKAVEAKQAGLFTSDWAAAQKVRNEQTRIEMDKRAEVDAAKAASEKRKYEQAVVEGDRRRRMGAHPTNAAN